MRLLRLWPFLCCPLTQCLPQAPPAAVENAQAEPPNALTTPEAAERNADQRQIYNIAQGFVGGFAFMLALAAGAYVFQRANDKSFSTRALKCLKEKMTAWQETWATRQAQHFLAYQRTLLENQKVLLNSQAAQNAYLDVVALELALSRMSFDEYRHMNPFGATQSPNSHTNDYVQAIAESLNVVSQRDPAMSSPLVSYMECLRDSDLLRQVKRNRFLQGWAQEYSEWARMHPGQAQPPEPQNVPPRGNNNDNNNNNNSNNNQPFSIAKPLGGIAGAARQRLSQVRTFGKDVVRYAPEYLKSSMGNVHGGPMGGRVPPPPVPMLGLHH